MPGPARSARALAVAGMLSLAGSAGEAQESPAPFIQVELRADVILARATTVGAAIGANVSMDPYLRTGIAAGAGIASRSGVSATAWRAELVTRYLLDPYREIAWAPYAGAGIVTQWNRGDHGRADLLVVLGLEGPSHTGWRVSGELGFGAGARLGVVLRRARSNGR